MFKVLIVEDEWFTRDSLINAIDWKSADCEVTAEAEDGKEALALIKLHSPDIVVSDIKMEVMDGIELCEQINLHYPEIRVILVTGHSEFEYAQQAVKLGVKDFILKPTDPEELLGAAKRISGEIESSRKRQDEYYRLQKVVEESIPLLQERFILELADGKPFDDIELVQRQEFLGLDFKSFSIAVLEIDNYEEFLQKHDERQRQILKLMICDLGEDMLLHRGSGYFIEKETNLFLILIRRPDTAEFAEELQQKILDITELSTSLGISCSLSNAENISIAFRQAMEALRRKFYIGWQSVISYKDLKLGDGIFSMVKAGDLDGLIEHILLQVKTGNKDGALQSLDRLFVSLHELKPDKSDYIKNIAFEIIILLQRLLLEIEENPTHVFTDSSLLADISNCRVMKEIRVLLGNSIEKTADLVNEKNKSLSQSVVKKIMEHLSHNFNKNISLEDLGNIAHMNPKYVCRLIKKETGSNFSDILLGIRIEKAKELLRQPDMKTYEIAEKVGIEDSRYFSKVFKKSEGITPTEYRLKFIPGRL